MVCQQNICTTIDQQKVIQDAYINYQVRTIQEFGTYSIAKDAQQFFNVQLNVSQESLSSRYQGISLSVNNIQNFTLNVTHTIQYDLQYLMRNMRSQLYISRLHVNVYAIAQNRMILIGQCQQNLTAKYVYITNKQYQNREQQHPLLYFIANVYNAYVKLNNIAVELYGEQYNTTLMLVAYRSTCYLNEIKLYCYGNITAQNIIFNLTDSRVSLNSSIQIGKTILNNQTILNSSLAYNVNNSIYIINSTFILQLPLDPRSRTNYLIYRATKAQFNINSSYMVGRKAQAISPSLSQLNFWTNNSVFVYSYSDSQYCLNYEYNGAYDWKAASYNVFQINNTVFGLCNNYRNNNILPK